MKANSPPSEPVPDVSVPDKSGLRSIVFFSTSPEATIAIGEKLGRLLSPGDTAALRGDLGTGKTCLVKGIARALGVVEEITSPTYTLVNEYAAAVDGAPVSFFHIDAYRLSGGADFEALGAREYLYGGGIAVIEWSGRVQDCLPPDAVTVEIAILEGGGRGIAVTAPEYFFREKA